MVAPASTKAGATLIAVEVLLWLVACQPPWRVIRSTTVLGLSLFLPYFLLLPCMGNGLDPRHWSTELSVVAGLFVRGMAGIFISVAAVSTLTASDLREGLARLPIPGVVSAILLQIIQQSAALGYETRRVAAAMSIRGASGGGRAAWRVLSCLPQVWLPRVIVRAERVAAAMEVRGYCEPDIAATDHTASGWADRLALVLLLAAIALALFLRYGRVP
jgi:cobalt/nickel transport system permease protein